MFRAQLTVHPFLLLTRFILVSQEGRHPRRCLTECPYRMHMLHCLILLYTDILLYILVLQLSHSVSRSSAPADICTRIASSEANALDNTSTHPYNIVHVPTYKVNGNRTADLPTMFDVPFLIWLVELFP